MAYTKTEWKARQGTNLKKFDKSQESAASVVLTNAPDAVTEPGTPISAENLNKIEQGIFDAHEGIAAEAAARAAADEGLRGQIRLLSPEGLEGMAELLLGLESLPGQMQELQGRVAAARLDAWPVGSIYMSIDGTSPADLFGGTWTVWGSGLVPVGVDTLQAEFNAVEKTGGAKTHALTASQMPSHTHGIDYINGNTFDSGLPNMARGARWTAPANPTSNYGPVNSSSAGGNGAHNNLQPYITCYMWKRTI